MAQKGLCAFRSLVFWAYLENGTKKMLGSVSQFTNMLSTEKLDGKMADLSSEKDRIQLG